jgi:hypothetical protein
MTWEARIDGPRAILRQLALAVSDDDIQLVTRDGTFFLRGPVLDRSDDAAEVRQEAERITTLLSGSARLCLGSTESLHVADVADAITSVEDDVMTPEGPFDSPPYWRTSPAIQKSDDGTAWPERSSIAQSVRAAMANGAMEEALRLRNAEAPDWPQIARIYAIVEVGVGGKRRVKALCGVTDAAIARLHAAAGSGRTRTASRSPIVDAPLPPMTLEEARRFVDHLLMAWLGSTLRRTAARR